MFALFFSFATIVVAQVAPAPTATPAAMPTDSRFAAQRPNDPCTSLSAIVNRPTVTNAVCTVRADHVLIETGWQNTSYASGGSTAVYPQAFVRVGTSIPNLEVNFTPPSAERSSVGGPTTSGTTDIGAGLKYLFGASPKFAGSAAFTATAPTGSATFSANGTTTTAALQGSYTISPVFSLAIGAQVASQLTSAQQRYASFIPSLVLGATLPRSSGLFLEGAAFTQYAGRGTGTRSQYMVGAYHDFGTRLQVDVEYGWSPNTPGGRYRFPGAGVSYAF